MNKIIPEVGAVYGKKTITSIDVAPRPPHQYVEVECRCGKRSEVAFSGLRYGDCDTCSRCNHNALVKKARTRIGEKVGSRTITGITHRGMNLMYRLSCSYGHEVHYPIRSVDAAGECNSCWQKVSSEEHHARREQRRIEVQALKDSGMNSTAIARKIGVSASMICHILKGRR